MSGYSPLLRFIPALLFCFSIPTTLQADEQIIILLETQLIQEIIALDEADVTAIDQAGSLEADLNGFCDVIGDSTAETGSASVATQEGLGLAPTQDDLRREARILIVKIKRRVERREKIARGIAGKKRRLKELEEELARRPDDTRLYREIESLERDIRGWERRLRELDREIAELLRELFKVLAKLGVSLICPATVPF